MKKKKVIFLKNKKGQIWIETIIYTLIAFALIGLVLAFVKPEIEEIQDKGFIERSIDALKEIDFIINTIGEPGNQRVIGLGINKGSFNIDGENNTLFFEIESRHEYSEPGEDIIDGNVIITTEEVSGISMVTLKINYTERYNITFDGKETSKRISQSPTPYSILIANNGKDDQNKTIINLNVVD
ncbi:MAG: hypothetical protein WDZ62_02560 [Candidatus Pacearchaeota archaeon]